MNALCCLIFSFSYELFTSIESFSCFNFVTSALEITKDDDDDDDAAAAADADAGSAVSDVMYRMVSGSVSAGVWH